MIVMERVWLRRQQGTPLLAGGRTDTTCRGHRGRRNSDLHRPMKDVIQDATQNAPKGTNFRNLSGAHGKKWAFLRGQLSVHCDEAAAISHNAKSDAKDRLILLVSCQLGAIHACCCSALC